MDFSITPFQQCGPFNWQMSPDEANAILGTPERTSRNGAGHLVQFRNNRCFTLVFDGTKKSLIEITNSQSDPGLVLGAVRINDLNSENVIRRLLELDEFALQGFGSIVFPRLGVSLTGYAPEDPEIRAASVFASGRWDDAARDMKPFRADPKRGKP